MATWQAALQDWGKNRSEWRNYWENGTTLKDLDKIGEDGLNFWDTPCQMCGIKLSRGAEQHIPSVKHCKGLQDKLGWPGYAGANPLPDPNSVDELNNEWVQVFPHASRRYYYFNHLTGDHLS